MVQSGGALAHYGVGGVALGEPDEMGLGIVMAHDDKNNQNMHADG